MSVLNIRNNRVFQDPPLAQKLINSSRAAWLWLPLRIYLGYQWISPPRNADPAHPAGSALFSRFVTLAG